jgi:hypothetical protein
VLHELLLWRVDRDDIHHSGSPHRQGDSLIKIGLRSNSDGVREAI